MATVCVCDLFYSSVTPFFLLFPPLECVRKTRRKGVRREKISVRVNPKNFGVLKKKGVGSGLSS